MLFGLASKPSVEHERWGKPEKQGQKGRELAPAGHEGEDTDPAGAKVNSES